MSNHRTNEPVFDEARRASRLKPVLLAVAVLVATTCAVAIPVAAVAPAAAAGPAPAMFVSLAPTRIPDTRIGVGAAQGVVPPNTSIDISIAGVGGVPTNATAVAFNLTATDAIGPGFVTAWPTGSTRPTVSNLNLQSAGATVANLVVVALPQSGKVSLYMQSGGSLIADVAGYWTPASGGTSKAGRFVAQSPSRILDTRDGTGADPGFRGAGATVGFSVAGRGGVPSAGASAAVLVVTATEAGAAGFITGGATRPPRPTPAGPHPQAGGGTRPHPP